VRHAGNIEAVNVRKCSDGAGEKNLVLQLYKSEKVVL
jgi:hypothetical protein